MRILVVIPFLPWPLDSGGNAAQFSTLQCFADDHQFTVICPISRTEQIEDARRLADALPRVRIRVVNCIPPAPSAPPTSAVRRWLRKLLRRRAAATASAASPPEIHDPFYAQPHALIAALLEEIAGGPDIVQLEFAELMPLASLLPASQRRLFVHHQVHAVYADRFVATYGATPFRLYLAAWMRRQEQAYLADYDAIIAFSEDDRRAIGKLVQTVPIEVSPFPVPADLGLPPAAAPSFVGRFVFIGSEPHQPNQDALAWLLQDIWPVIANHLPTAELVVVGAWSKRWRAAATTRVRFSGWVDNLGPVLRGAIQIVPIRIGSGIRTKILAAFAAGAAVVSTIVGAEGILAQADRDLMTADSAEGLAAAAIRLAESSALWNRLVAGGRSVVTAHYAPEVVRRRRNEIYAAVMAGRHTPIARPSI